MTLRRRNIRTQVSEEATQAEEAARKQLASTRSDVQVPGSLDASTSTPLDVSTLARPDTQELESASVQTFDERAQSDEASRRPDVRALGREKGRQTVYFPSDLRKWIKKQAIDAEMEISDYIAMVMQQHRDRIEGRS